MRASSSAAESDSSTAKTALLFSATQAGADSGLRWLLQGDRVLPVESSQTYFRFFRWFWVRDIDPKPEEVYPKNAQNNRQSSGVPGMRGGVRYRSSSPPKKKTSAQGICQEIGQDTLLLLEQQTVEQQE